MLQPGRQYVTDAQAQADAARWQRARREVWKLDTQLRLHEVERAFHNLREASAPETRQRATDELDRTIKKLHEVVDQMKEIDTPPERLNKEKEDAVPSKK
jgi:hypothetical protein